MKMILLAGVIFLCMSFMTMQAYAQEKAANETSQDKGALIDTADMRYEKSPINKLGRGLMNTLTCFLEVPGEIYEESKEKDPFVGVTWGLVRGTCTALMRGLSGVYDVATFIIPPYNRPLMQPEYAIQSFTEKYQRGTEQVWTND